MFGRFFKKLNTNKLHIKIATIGTLICILRMVCPLHDFFQYRQSDKELCEAHSGEKCTHTQHISPHNYPIFYFIVELPAFVTLIFSCNFISKTTHLQEFMFFEQYTFTNITECCSRAPPVFFEVLFNIFPILFIKA